MATIKHISSKNADYGAAEQYLTFEHDEFTMKPVLDKNGRLIPHTDYRMDTLNCGNEDFALSCIRANMRYGKNNQREDIKSHHYIISFDPRDAPDNGLTVDKAQELGLAYCKEQFPGHQAVVCTHPGHDLTGLERFMPETRRMITLDVLNNDSPVGYKGERYRFFLSDEGYHNARKSEQRGEIKIKSHAAVTAGKLYPDKKPEIDR